MKNIFVLVILIQLTCQLPAFGKGGEVSGGGSGVLLQNGSVQSLELYRALNDNPKFRWNAKIFEKFGQIDFINSVSGNSEKDALANSIFNFLVEEYRKNLSEKFANLILSSSNKIGEFYEDPNPEPIADFQGPVELKLKSGERIVQVLRRYNNHVFKNPKLWARVSVLDRVAFKLHESLHAISYLPSTYQVQLLVGWLLSDEVNRASSALLDGLRLDQAERLPAGEFSDEILPGFGFPYLLKDKNELPLPAKVQWATQVPYVTMEEYIRQRPGAQQVAEAASALILALNGSENVVAVAKDRSMMCGMVILEDLEKIRPLTSPLTVAMDLKRKGVFPDYEKYSVDISPEDLQRLNALLTISTDYFKSQHPISFYSTSVMKLPTICFKKTLWRKVFPVRYFEVRFAYTSKENEVALEQIKARVDYQIALRQGEQNEKQAEADIHAYQDLKHQLLSHQISLEQFMELAAPIRQRRILAMEKERDQGLRLFDLSLKSEAPYISPPGDLKQLEIFRFDFSR